MKKLTSYTLLLLLACIPTFTYAQGTLQLLIVNTTRFLQNVIIPALLSVAFLIVAINMLRYFVWRSGDEQGRADAKNFAIYATAAFVAVIIFAGLVNFFAYSIGAQGCSQPMTDYEKLNFIGPHLPPCP
jgi:hypothetical protein